MSKNVWSIHSFYLKNRPMAMGTRKQREKQEGIWIAHTELAAAPGHPFYH
jgi:hypothetical protein